MAPYPQWLRVLAWEYLLLCAACALFMIVDFLRGNRQKMWIMHLVWPVTAMYFGPVALWLYFRTRPLSLAGRPGPDKRTMEQMKETDPTREQVAVAVYHCGAGCAMGDILGEAGLFAIGGMALNFIAGSEFITKLTVDCVLAYALGIFFQYFTIVPMRGLPFRKGVLAAMRADTISILAFELGMFAWMAFTRFVLFSEPNRIYPDSAVYWLMMQVAMIIGWATSYPANVWLIKKGWKERMPQYPSMEAMKRHKGLRAA